MWRERGRVWTGRGKGVERNVLGLDRLEDIFALCLFFPTHRYVML